MAKINPDKLVTNLKIKTGVTGTLELNYDLPVDFIDGEEIVITRRKDAFPVELRNPTYEDRYTDVAQVEVFRGYPIYCSNLIPNGDKLTIGSGNSFLPAISEFERDNKYTGRLIRDSLGQVFVITGNTEAELSFDNITKSDDNILIPTEGPYVILADFTKVKTGQIIQPLLLKSNTLKIVNNSFSGGDKITLNNSIDLEFNIDWLVGITPDDTAENIKKAIELSGINYSVTRFDDVLLIEQNTEDILAISTNNASIEVVGYGVNGNKIFIVDGTYSKNELRNRVVQSGIDTYFIKRNEGKEIELYESIAAETIPNRDFAILSTHENGFVSGYKDNYRNYLEALTKKGTGLETEKFYYYTTFNTPLLSLDVSINEQTLNTEDPANYNIDKLASYNVRVFFEDTIHLNSGLTSFTYNNGTGEVTFLGNPDLSSTGILIGHLFADDKGRRHTITDVSNLGSGIIGLSAGLTLSETIRTELHGSVTNATLPVSFGAIQVGDTFKDVSGNSFEIMGITAEPISGLTTPPSNSFDIIQGLTDQVIMSNEFIVPFTYDPDSGVVQYGERTLTLNKLLSAFSYSSITGVVQYSGGTIDLTPVTIGDTFVDSDATRFEILDVNHQNQTVTLSDLLTVSNTVVNNRDGSIIDEVGFTDVEGNSLIDLSEVQIHDLLKTNSKSNIPIVGVNVELGQVVLENGIEDISTIIVTPFDGSIIRRGKEVSDTNFGDNPPINVNQGAVRRYNSVNDSVFALFSSIVSTQAFAISAEDRGFGNYMYNLFPNSFRVLDKTGDLEDITKVFGKEFNEIFSFINTLELQNANILIPSALKSAASSVGIDLTSEILGIDTRRRIMRDLIATYKKKGNRAGIADFIKIITTWDITNGTGDLREAIIDDTPETVGLKFYSASLGTTNTNIIDTLEVNSPPAGRFYKGIAGITLPGFFQFQEVLINLPNIALELGLSTDLSNFEGNTTLRDDNADFGITNALKGCFLVPSEGNPNDFYIITSNDDKTITVDGGIPNGTLGAKYIVLSPLNMNRFNTISSLISEFLPHKTVAVFNFKLTV